jgi:two-component system sensor histidine kinase/response regulator
MPRAGVADRGPGGAKILVVEDDFVVSRDLQQQLARLGHVVVGATARGEDAVVLARDVGPDLVLMDIRLAGALDGIDAAQQIRQGSQVPVIYLTAYADDQTLRRAAVTEPFGYLLKPFEDSQLRTAIELALYKHGAERRLRESERRFAITLSSIGDAVIATDDQLRITFVNAVAEALTGWAAAAAMGRPLGEVVRIVHEQTGGYVEDAAARVLRLGAAAGAAASVHGALVARDGRRVPIDDVGAPIVDERGHITGVVLVFRDMTQRRRAEEAEALREVNARISAAVRGSSIGIWELVAGGPGRVTAWNLFEHLGHPAPAGPIDRATWSALVHPDDRAALDAAVDAGLGGAGLEIASRFRHGDGSYRWLLTRGVAVPGRAGRRLVGTSADVTDRTRAEDALRQSEHRFRTLVDHATDSFLLYDQDARVLDVNRQLCASLGYRADELIGKTPLDFDPDLTSGQLAAMIERLAGGEVVAFESRHRRKDGTSFPVEVRARQFTDGGAVRIVSLVRDVTAREHIAAALRRSEARFRGIFASAGAGIALCDLDGRHLQVNPTYAALVGRDAGALVALTVIDVVHPDDAGAGRAAMAALAGGAISAGCEARCPRAEAWVHLTLSLQRDDDGRPVHVIAVMQDISERKRLEEQLRRATAAAEAANRAKDEFLANVSHEIRTPMNAILGMTELVLDTPLGDGQRQALGTARSAAESLLGTINDLLDFSKIEAGKLGLDVAPFALRATVGDILRALAVRAHRKGLELVCSVAPAVPDALVGDAGRLRQVLINLVGNAIKFTDQGHVLVEIDRPDGDGDGDGAVLRFAVRDTGVGIPRDRQASIFRAFEQEDASTTRRHGGTGLGLTIAARLIGLMDGTLAVDSAPGQGSTFTFTAHVAVDAVPPVAVGGGLAGHRVLVVDDSAIHRHVVAGWLRARGALPTTVADGAAALDAVVHGGPYAALVVDARLPGTDAGALVDALGERSHLGPEHVVLLTVGEPAEVGVAALMKPVPEDELVAAIERAIAGQGVRRPVARALSAPAAALRILVAEDSDLNARLYRALLGRAGHQVTLVSHGRDAVVAAATDRFDLLLLDLHMPELDGFAVIAAIRDRERETGGHLPVIAVTARSRPEDRTRCLAAGMDDFLAKPFAAADLAAVIERVAAGAAPRPGGLLSPAVLLASCGSDPVILGHICAALRDRLPVELAAVSGARAAGDAANLREAAHKLCSMVAAFSTAMSGVASDLEDHAAGGRLDLAAPLVDRLESMAPALAAAVADLSVDALRAAL